MTEEDGGKRVWRTRIGKVDLFLLNSHFFYNPLCPPLVPPKADSEKGGFLRAEGQTHRSAPISFSMLLHIFWDKSACFFLCWWQVQQMAKTRI